MDFLSPNVRLKNGALTPVSLFKRKKFGLEKLNIPGGIEEFDDNMSNYSHQSRQSV
jgi:hypothetical protein